jgi:hypothetical protein
MFEAKKFKGYLNLSGWSKFMNRKITFCLIITFLLTNFATADLLQVPTPSYPTIEAAINAAIDGDEIRVADGSYTPFSSDGYDLNGKLIWLHSQNGPQNCIINCNNTRRAFYFHNGETSEAKIEGFTIKNGNAYYGGAIECEIDSSPTIIGCIITNNIAVYGGAIDCFYSSPVIKNCIIANNTTDLDGGAIECGSESSPVIKNCLIINNTAGGYGAIDYFDGSSPAITNCTIANNTGDANLGGVHATDGSMPTIRNSILWNNGDDIYGATATYSCIQDSDAGTGNIHTDPIFKTGPYFSYGNYYLSQTDAGQFNNSPCIDTGLGSPTVLDTGHRITRTDNVDDSGTIDMGFHYQNSSNANYVLTTAVDPNGNFGTILPASGQVYKQFTDVTLTATPNNSNYRVEKWTIDANDVNDTNTTRIITMDSDHTVTVKFGSTICYLTTYVISGNGSISPSYPPPSSNSFPKNSQHTIYAYPTDPNTYGVNRWLKGETATFDINDSNTYTVSDGPNTTYPAFYLTTDTTVAVEFGRYMLDPRVTGGNGTVSPRRGYQPARKTVTLTAEPSYGYKVKQWTGTDNNSLTTLTNTVTMTSNRNVTVEFNSIPQYTLTTTAASGAIIDPYYPTGYLINENTVVQLTATIPTGTVVVWSGADDNNSISILNTVKMDANHNVSVSYRTPRVLHVPGQYPTITSAVSAAISGDKIIVSQRIGNPYREANINLGSKRLTITSEHPDDPCCVEATVIDCQNAGRAFIIRGGSKDPNHVVIDGFTIINGSAISGPQSPPNTNGRGQDGSDANGGAIVCYGGASPTISNCIFRNCIAEGQKGENATYIYPVLPDQDEALETPESPGQNGAVGINGIDGADGYDGGDGGDAHGGALFFDANGSPRILHCQFINCFALGGNGGFGGQGQDGQDGQAGQPGSGGDADTLDGGDGGDGGNGGDGGDGGDGGNGGNATGGAIYFAGNNNAVIQYCEIIECNAIPGLGNVAGNGSGAGSSGANAGNGGNGATGGTGATGGSDGANGNGAAGGIGGYGGNGGTNGDATAGGIYFGNKCIIQMSDTNFIGNHTTTKVASFAYDAGDGGNGGNGGAGGGETGNSGVGGGGGDAGAAGNAGDGIYIGDGANGGIGGDGGGSGDRQARGGNGGNGSSGATGGNGGNGGNGNPDGSDGSDGADNVGGWISMSSLAGCNYYGQDSNVILNNCTFLKNHTQELTETGRTISWPSDGGAEYYESRAAAKMNNCTFSENSAGATGDGGAQLFIWRNNIDINNCTYNKNTSVFNGGAVFAGYDVNLAVTDSTFADNTATAPASYGYTTSYGGGIYWNNNGYLNKTATISNSYFTNNESGFGGGLYWFDNDTNNTTTIIDCVFTENSADHGGGLYWSKGVPTISGCIFNRNHANGRWALLNYNWIYDEFFGGGGAIFGFASDGIIKDCTITDNTTSGSGGGIYIGGEQTDPNRHPQINNCLIAGNSAVLDGGGIISYWFASPQITNCTIAGNIAYDPADASHGRGGGISCSYESNATMTNCILWDNETFRSNHGNQIAIGSNSDPVYLQRPAELTVSFSDIQNWSDPNQIYVFPGRILNLDANTVFDDNPQFVSTYFLASTSPCIDRGNVNSSILGLDTYTTQIDNSLDTGIVDIGYHYALHKLTLVIIGHGSISVDEPNHYDPITGTYHGSIFGLTAHPDDGYRVKSWTGTDVSPLWNSNTNTVTMTGDKVVTVEFEVDSHRDIDVPGDVPGIQDAIDQAQDGDTIRIHAGTYVGTGFIVDRKNITIRGEPLNPGAVIIDCAGESPLDLAHKGFVLIGDNQHSVTLTGLSIINSDTTVLRWDIGDDPGADGRPTKAERDNYDYRSNYGGAITIQGNHTVRNCIIRNCAVRVYQSSGGNPGEDPNDEETPTGGHNGGDGGFGGNAGGAGIYVQWGDANIVNVTIEDCYAIGGDANSGATGYEDMNDAYPAGTSGNGGDGGNVFGAGILIRSGKSYLENVIVRNCVGRAGNGGNGAVGAINTAGGDGGLPGRVKGAGIYCSTTSEPVFVNCTVENCRAYGGRGGNGGDGGEWVDTRPPTKGGYGGLTTASAAGQGDIRMFSSNGGAVFCEDESRAKFTHCAFVGNRTYGSISGMGGLWHLPADWREQPRQNYRLPSFGAGVFCSTASDVAFNGCHFENNRTAYNQDFNDPNYLAAVGLTDINDYNGDLIGFGGGLCLWYTFTTEINECNFVINSAPLGGGIHSTSSDIYINDCNVINNISTAGGGILALDSTGTISKSIIKGNTAGTQTGYYGDTSTALFGTGGGIYALDSLVDINDTVITENYARFTGAGICLDGDTPYPVRPSIKNCLITANTATQVGGGIAATYFAEPNIQNCTITKNIASDVNGSGGGLFASYAADVIVKDSIFWANSGIDGSQIAMTKGGSTDRPAKLAIKYSDIDLRTGIDFNSIGSSTGTATTTGVLVDSQTINNELTASGSAKVIVSLVEPAGAQTTNWSSPASVSSLQSQIATLQNQVLSTFSTGEFTLRQKLTNAAIFSGQVTQAGLNKLMSNSSVAHIEPVRTVHPMLAQAIPLANALDTRPVYNGSGISVAIVDSGVDYTHPRLGGGGFPNSKVIGGYDTGDNDNNPMPSDEAHGTSCAGIAAGLLGTFGDYIGGVAYNAKIYALKLTTDAGLWPTDSTLAAWDWCITHRNDDPVNPIRVMSNSWGATGYPINNAADGDAYSPAHTIVAQTAVNAGITILAAAGNDGFAGQGISWPAAMSNVISVGAVYDTTDQVTEYSNTADILDILAPADPVYTTDIVGAGGYDPGDYFPLFGGTSSACPFAAGSVAALQSAAKQLRGEYLAPSEVRTLLRITGDSITDTKVAITKPRVNLGSAISLLSQVVPIYREDTSCTITGLAQDANGNWIVDDHNNISKDPNFVSGYYLSHIATGQDIDSNCIDAGSATAAALGLNTYTTRIDGVFDAYQVDMGFHYQVAVPQYDITVKILADANYPGTHGYVTADPNRLVSYDANTATYKFRFYVGMIPTLTAVPDANYYLLGWYDEQNTQLSSRNTFNFTVDANDTYFVRFKPKRTISVSGGGDALRNAVNTAENGDTLIVAAGTYNGGIDISGKQIKLYGVNPDDPNIIEKTIIDCSGSNTRGFTFSGGETANTVINGFTIINGGGDGIEGGAIFIDANSSPLIVNVDINDCSVQNASGGAIYISSASNPEFRNVNITNCIATINGGGVYISSNSNPIFRDCSIADCNAGINGGAVYCRTLSNPQFINCSFTGNYAADSAGAIFYETLCNIVLEGCKFTANIAGLDAGAVMCSADCVIDINNCNVADNNSGGYGGGVYIDADCDGRIHNTNMTANSAYEDGGAIYIVDSNTIGIADCNIIANTALRGGGIFALESPKVIIYDCSINSNEAYRGDLVGEGGGIYAFRSIEQIADCKISGNRAYASGGGIYISGEQEDTNYPLVKNCLIANNQSNRDGGGISVNWFATAKIQICTIVDNNVSPSDGYGGGVSCAYEAYTKVINSILWNNNAQYGPEISIGSDFDAADKLPAEVSVSYSDVQDGKAGVFVDTANGGVLNWDDANSHNINSDPNFVLGYWGNYYLSQIITNDPLQTVDSNCVDAGLGSAISNGMYRHTTRTDYVIDIADSNVDMGYHYTLSAEILGDFNFDGIVDLQDLALLMLYWLQDNCTFPYWCYGTDLNEDGKVDFEDYALFAENYGQTEKIPPQPDPMTWAISPYSAGLHEVAMKATIAMDMSSGSQVQYYFKETTGHSGGSDSGWTTSRVYTDTSLSTGTQYGYEVKAKDARDNETGWSVIGYAVAEVITPTPTPTPTGTPTPTPTPDITPPTYTPTTAGLWVWTPHAVYDANNYYWYHSMTAVAATDTSLPLTYFFKCVSGSSSDWTTTTQGGVEVTYNAGGWTGENPAAYRVRITDAAGNYVESTIWDTVTGQQ